MQPNRLFAVLILLLAGALLLSGYLMSALLAAVFGVLAFVARSTGSSGSSGTNRDEGFIAHVGSSSWPSSDGGGNDNACDADSSDSDGGGDCGGGDSGGGGD